MKMLNKKGSFLVMGAAAAVALAGCAANTAGGSGNSDDGALEVVSWWTSGSEEDALNVLFDAFTEENPNVGISNAAVSGGGGANATQALNTRLQAGSPPDTWQLHPDGQLASYVEGGNVLDITDLWESEGWASQLPEQLAELQKVDGSYYTVPVGVHRGNVLWLNTEVLDEKGIDLSGATTGQDLIEQLSLAHGDGTTGLCLGSKDIFAASLILEAGILSTVDATSWNGFFTGETSFDIPEVRQALEDFDGLLDISNSDHSALTWDEAVMNMANGQCAASLMGDWAYGELAGAGFEPQAEFDWLVYPAAEQKFAYVGDGFSLPSSNAPNAEAGEDWLKILMDPEVQAEFAAKKGSIPAVTSADTASLSEYQQSAADDLANDAIVSSFAMGQAGSGELGQAFADALTAFVGDRNIDGFISSMVDAQDRAIN